MSSPGTASSAPNRRQKRMGPAPFASFEDLSDELDSPEDKNTSGSVVRLPGIREDITPLSPAPQEIKTEFVYTGISLIGAPSTPTMAAPTVPKCSLETPAAPRIDISRASSSSHHDSKDSSPERELFAQDQNKGLGFREEGTLDLRSSTEELDFQEKKVQPQRPHSPVTLQEDSYQSHHRKDSQSSEIGLLCISGRTSRLSSIGSQGSAHSRVSNASHLSVISGQSGVSRSPSPHKMLLETSFCGTKPQKKEGHVKEGTKDELEKVLLKRKHDPTKALLAEGIKVEEIKKEELKKEVEVKPQIQEVKNNITITIDKPYEKSKLPKRIVGESGTEYIYIPLKGPLPEDNSNGIPKTKVRETRSASIPGKVKEVPMKSSKSASPSPVVSRHFNDEPKYIRIKLKADHMYDEYDKVEFQKPDTLDFNNPKKSPQTFEQILSYQPTPSASPKHLTPSPSLSRKSSFTSIFKSRESISPESPTTITRRKNTLSGLGDKLKERRRSRSKSRDRSSVGPSSTESIDSKGRQKSMFSIFKTKKTSQTNSPELPNLEGLVNVESKKMPKKKYYETPLEGDSIRIPLHSPNYYEQKHMLQDFKTSSQDSQETVIEVPQKNNDKKQDCRQSSTSSENIVFSTRIGSTNELFITKLPKDKNAEVTTAIVETQNVQIKEEVESPYNEKADERLQKSCHKLTNDVKSIETFKEVVKVEEKVLSKNEESKRKPLRDSKIDDKVVSKAGVRIRLKDYSMEEPVENIEVEKIENKKICLKDETITPEETVVKVRKSRSSQRFQENTRKNEENKLIEKESLFGDTEVDWTSAREKVDEDQKADIKVEGRVSRKLENSVKNIVVKQEIKVEKEDVNWFPNEFLDEKLEKFEALRKAQKELNSVKKSISRERFSKEEETNQPTPTPQEIRPQEEVPEVNDQVIPDSTSVQDDHYSSESERDSEIDKKETPLDQVEPERKGLVLQQDSFEDELPYIPTTLPQERSVAVPIIPIKQRSTFEMKTCPIERPRSTTPINPTCLEDYCEEVIGNINTETITKTIEKLRISLPRDDSTERPKEKSPRKTNTANWFDFSKLKKTPDEAPPLPPKGIQKEWINFEEIPEKRKPPKRIQTIPSRGNIEVPESVLQENVIYTYVNPEDCKCECHERANQPAVEEVREDELPLLEDDNDEEKTVPAIDTIKLEVTIIDRRSIISDSSVDLSTNIDQPDANGIDHSLQTPFTSDLGISSNRSSIISQEDAQSPDTDSPNAFPKT